MASLRSITCIVTLVAIACGLVATSDCGGKLDLDLDASTQDVVTADHFNVDAPYGGQCCNIYDGSTAGPCDHDANEFGWGGSPLDNEAGVYFCGYDYETVNLDGGVGDWRHCAYQTGHRWLCCVPADPSCCPKIAEPDDAGNPPAHPGACNGIEPADGY